MSTLFLAVLIGLAAGLVAFALVAAAFTGSSLATLSGAVVAVAVTVVMAVKLRPRARVTA